jgi:glucose/arabinose dehydrogenase
MPVNRADHARPGVAGSGARAESPGPGAASPELEPAPVPSAPGERPSVEPSAWTPEVSSLPLPAAGDGGLPAGGGAPLGPDCAPPEGALPGLRLTELASDLNQPTFVTAAPKEERRLFVLERSGVVRIVRDGQLLPEPFLDLSERVSTFNEEGLLGLAFHPDYQDNGRFFVQYTSLDPSRPSSQGSQAVLSELSRSKTSAERADPESERTLMLVEQASDLHIGGMLAFGPLDGMLYMSRGEGGSKRAQDPGVLFGKMLRIDVDVDTGAGERRYGIPEGNMRGDGVLPEIWSLGLRNPWRFSFDACTADLYIGDVGESSFEEINFEPANTPGRNYGWEILEGPECFAADACDADGSSPPVSSYGRGFGCAVISGYVYRGQRIPALRGTYLYADYCSGRFGSFRVEAGEAVDVRELTSSINPDAITLITSFGADNAGELYVLSQTGGLYRIDPE